VGARCSPDARSDFLELIPSQLQITEHAVRSAESAAVFCKSHRASRGDRVLLSRLPVTSAVGHLRTHAPQQGITASGQAGGDADSCSLTATRRRPLLRSDNIREPRRPAIWQHHRVRRWHPRHPHQASGLHPKCERIGYLEGAPRAFRRTAVPILRLLPLVVRRLSVNDLNVETG